MVSSRPDVYLGVAFNADPFDVTAVPAWSDLTARVYRVSSATRGRQYELDRNQAGNLSVDWHNADEALNPVNAGSPYWPNVVSYRQIVFQAMWPPTPVGAAVNLVNSNAGYDPTFESYTNGQTLSWATSVGGTTVAVSNVSPQTGANCVGTGLLVAGATVQGLALGPFYTIPGRSYTASAQVRPGGAFSVQISVQGGVAGGTASTAGSYTQISVTFTATQPQHTILVQSSGTVTANTVKVDGLQLEPVQVLNANPYAETGIAPWTSRGSTLTRTTTLPHEGSWSFRVTPDGVTAVVEIDSEVVPAAVGAPTRVAGWFRCAVSRNMNLNINWFGAPGYLDTSIGPNVALTANVWTFIEFTANGVAGTTGAQAAHSMSGTPLASNVLDADEMTLVNASPSAFSATGPLVRPVWTRGYVERWPIGWVDGGFRGISVTPCVGPLAILQNADLHAEVRGAVAAKSPKYYWPLQEPDGAVAFAEVSGNGGPPLRQIVGKKGAGNAYVAGTASVIAGDPGGTGVKFKPVVGSAGIGTVLGAGLPPTPTLAPLPATPAAAWAAAGAFWIQANPVVYDDGSGTILSMLTNGSNPQLPFIVIVDNTGHIGVYVQNAATTINATSTITVTDGRWHHVAFNVAQTASNSTITVFIDGVSAASTTVAIGSFALLTKSATTAVIGATVFGATGNVLDLIDGTVSHAAVWYRNLTAGEIADLAAASRGYAGETEATRISRYLALAGFTGPTNIQTGASIMGPGTVKEGDALLDSCQQASDSAFGNLFEDVNGAAYASRNTRYLRTASVYTFGENVAAGEYPYEGDIVFDFDPQPVLNIADVTRTGGIKAHAEDAASQRRYGKKNFTRTVDIASDNETQDAATWTVSNRKDPLMRVASVTFDPSAVRVPFGDGTLWPMILTLEIGTRVTVKRRPKAANAGTGITMSADFFVEAINQHDLDFEAGKWKTTLLLSPVNRAQPWILEHATYGVLDSTTVLGF